MGPFRSLRSVVRFRRLETDPVARRLQRAASVEDLRAIARRRLPRGVFDYIDGGAEDELSLGRNVGGFARAEFRPRVLRDVAATDPSTTVLGRRLPFPVILAPTGFTRIANSQGELAVARAAARNDLPYTLSTLSTRSIEEVAAVSSGPKMVPGVRVARPRPGQGDAGPRGGVRLRGDHAHRRYRGPRSP